MATLESIARRLRVPVSCTLHQCQALIRAISYIEGNLESRITIDQLAATAGWSRSHFQRVFGEKVGVCPTEYIQLRRIQAAMVMMRTTSEKLSAIAINCGHGDQAHFTRVFRRLVGMPPRRWRDSASGSGPLNP